jgi:Protein of unknown function (DUF3616)
MANGFLLSRVLLRFGEASDDLLGDLSAVALTPDGSLWVGSDEFTTLERLSPLAPHVFGNHHSYALGDFVPLANTQDEIDIEGMDYAQPYLWLTGSHSTKRRKTKGKKPHKDIARLETIQRGSNRYLLARLPVCEGTLVTSYNSPAHPETVWTAGCLQPSETGNVLMEALQEDRHLGPFLTSPLPAKENGFDIEGLAVHQDRVFLGLRGPVLGGWAIILDIEVEEHTPGVLTLKEIGPAAQRYRKHFVDLHGLGVRELCLQGEDLIILAGPTMDLEGAMRVFRLRNALGRQGDSLTERDTDALEVLFDVPFTIGGDHAEGLALYSCVGQAEALLIVYDAPHPARRPEAQAVYADVFRLS